MDEEGGGASRTTDPAAGTSSGTDVSLREYINARMNALDRQISSDIAALRHEIEATAITTERSVGLAASEARDRLEAHNNLIGQMREQQATFATRETVEQRRKELDTRIETMRDSQRQSLIDFKDSVNVRFQRIESWQAKVVGGIGVVLAIGIANLVKIWTG